MNQKRQAFPGNVAYFSPRNCLKAIQIATCHVSFIEANVKDSPGPQSISTGNFCKYNVYNRILKRNKAHKEARHYNLKLVETRYSKNGPTECPNTEVIRYRL